ncbi:hypothetical protein CA51_22350 [Rosistilla oblonga]|nr:hypothetical protein CA51_22350 [Rosistilla oblonga]
MELAELEQHVARATRTTVNKFRGHPELVFTKLDLHSYCCSQIQSGRRMIRRTGQRHAYLLNWEYPTSLRYHNQELTGAGRCASAR